MRLEALILVDMEARYGNMTAVSRDHVATTCLHLSALCGVYLSLNYAVAGAVGCILALAVLIAGVTGYRLLPSSAVMRLRRALPVPPSIAWQLRPLVERLSARAGLATPPMLWLLRDAEINAFTVEGSDRPALAVSEGALRFCTRDELGAVVAHELSHLRSRDQPLMHAALFVHTATTTLGALLVLATLLSAPFALFGVLELPGMFVLASALAFPAASALLVLSLSRTREFAADLDAARLTGGAAAMAAALRRITRVEGLLERFGRRRSLLPEMLSTHPHLDNRIAHLRRARLDGA